MGRGVCVCPHACVRMESVFRSVWKYCSKLGGGHVGESEGLSGRDAYGGDYLCACMRFVGKTAGEAM